VNCPEPGRNPKEVPTCRILRSPTSPRLGVLSVLSVLSQTIVAKVAEMTRDLTETRQALEEAYR